MSRFIRVTERCLAALVAYFCLTASLVAQDNQSLENQILDFSGATMGTRYTVKIFDPPQSLVDIQIDVDVALRRVNDQMSTYLKSSEISRFNASQSTEWFEVSKELAAVVSFAQKVSQQTDGAFDVTVGPLVNAWSFGPDPRTREVPEQAVLDQLKRSVGYQKLAVRLDPPALKKSVPELQIDLSAIAKGFAVDQVVKLLNDREAENVFVEIGGEVRTSGSKAGQWWRVGIQLPDARENSVMIAHAMNTGGGEDQSMATSGDYRNFFEVDGIRYSHTIDPRTAEPIRHPLASVTVVADRCMKADAWATALNVLGSQRGLEVAREQKLHSLLISRVDGDYQMAGTGVLERYASTAGAPSQDRADLLPANIAGNNRLAVLLITVVAFAMILFAMAVGVVFGRRSISGSCGGLANSRDADGNVSCSLCSNPDDACKELRERMHQGTDNPG